MTLKNEDVLYARQMLLNDSDSSSDGVYVYNKQDYVRPPHSWMQIESGIVAFSTHSHMNNLKCE